MMVYVDYFLNYPVCSNVNIGELIPSLLICDILLHSKFLQVLDQLNFLFFF